MDDVPREQRGGEQRGGGKGSGEKRTGADARAMSAAKHNRNEARRQQDKPAAGNAFAAAFAAAQNKKR